MSKERKFSIASTLNKNKEKAEAPQLPEKVALPKAVKNEEAVKRKVEEIHAPLPQDTPKTTGAGEGTKLKKRTSTVKAAETTENVRITIDVPKNLYKKMKLHTVETETTIRNFVLDLIAKGIKVR